MNLPISAVTIHIVYAERQAKESENHLLETLREAPFGVSG